MQVTGKVWVVTGGGNGIGRELVLEMLRRGARVAAVDRADDALQQTAALAAAGERLSTHAVDITDRAAVAALPQAVVAAHGTVDGLVNNAGIIQPFVPVAELDEAVIARVMDVNFWGTVHMTQAFLPLLRARPEAHLANVSSMGGFFPFPGQTAYGASKAAVKLFTEGLYAEHADTPLRVSVILPGAIHTSISEHSGIPRPAEEDAAAGVPMTAPDKAALIILKGLERDRLHVYVGTDARVMSLAVKVAPRHAITFVRRQMAKHMPDTVTQAH
jgi:NAD(P)-dependent dehydrogenase (short-subunit alcohol dehydrogenase family)